MLILLSACTAICRYALCSIHYFLFSDRETRKTDTEDKHLELVETLYCPSTFLLMLIYIYCS